MPGMKQNRTGRKTGKTSRQERGRVSGQSKMGANPYIAMVADPCNSTLVPGIYGSSEGLLAKFKTSLGAFSTSGLDTCGYCLWCPDYTNDSTDHAGIGMDMNLFVWSSNLPGLQPANTATDPYGRLVPNTVNALPDPASNLLKSDIVADARVISACMQMTYYGAMMDAAGEVGFVENLPAHQLLDGGLTGNPFSVNELMQHVNNKQRFGVDTLEAVYRLNEGSSCHFRGVNDGLFHRPPTLVTPTTMVAEAQVLSPRVFGFVWRNVAPNAGITLDFTKAIEFRAEVSSGILQVPIKTIGTSLVPSIQAAIDAYEERTGKSVWERIKQSSGSAVSHIAQMAFSGTGQALLKSAHRNLMQPLITHLVSKGVQALPLIMARTPAIELKSSGEESESESWVLSHRDGSPQRASMSVMTSLPPVASVRALRRTIG